MRKFLCAALAFVLALGLCACGAGEGSPPAESEATAALTIDGSRFPDNRQPQLVAQDTENNLYLYLLPGDDSGVVLIWNDLAIGELGASAWFDWRCSAAWRGLPEIGVLDLDELAVTDDTRDLIEATKRIFAGGAQ
jgi:hypothetical protein